MATPAELRDAALKELRATRKAMLSTEWELALEGQSADAQKAAGVAQLNVGKAIRALENTALFEFRDKLAENENALTAGIADLKAARETLTKVKKALQAIDKVLGVLLRVVQFAALSA